MTISNSKPNRPLLLAHRGYHCQAPENTLDAFAQAIALGADGIETDIRLDAQGQAILFHDRIAPDGRPVASCTRQQLSDLVGYRVPTLQEALDRRPDLFWNLEIKTPSAAQATAAILQSHAYKQQILLTSFWHPLVEQLCAELGLEGGYLVSHRHRIPLEDSLPVGGSVRTIVRDFETCDAEALSEAQAAGIRNFVYGAVTVEELAQLAQWPVQGVITDFPQLWQS